MAILLMDSFDHLSTADLGGKHFGAKAGQASIVTTAQRTGRGALLVSGASCDPEMPANDNGLITRASSVFFPGANYTGPGTAAISVAMKANTAPAGARCVIKSWAEQAPATAIAELRVTNNGVFQVWTSAFAPGDFTATLPQTVFDNQWHYIEWQVNHTHQSDIQLWYDGVQILDSGTSAVTTIAGGTHFQLLDFSGNGASWFDDLVICERGDPPLGAPRVHVVRPVADGFATEWTPSPGTGDDYEEIDEELPDFNSTHLESTGGDEEHLSDYEDLALDDPTILATQEVNMVALVAGAGDTIRHLRRDVGTSSLSPADLTNAETWDLQLTRDGVLYGCALNMRQGTTYDDLDDFNDDEFGLEAE